MEVADSKLKIKARHLSFPVGDLNTVSSVPAELPAVISALGRLHPQSGGPVLWWVSLRDSIEPSESWDALWPRATLSQMTMISRFS